MSDQRAAAGEGMRTSFGFRPVADGEKQGLVDTVFHRVAERYDLMNDLMSGGLHRLWKDGMVAWLNPPKRAGWKALDVAGGTGDVAFRIVEASNRAAHVTVLDINSSMLAVGQDRATRHHVAENVDFIEANAEGLPFADNSFDAYTIAFGIRNVPRIEAALAEARRVLDLGGHFLCLEFSRVDVPMLQEIYDLYSFNVIPALGRAIAGDAEPYRYLVESIRRFPRPERFAEMMREAGFARVSWRPLSGGIVALHSGWRL
jgi:demethylmenaquinone methyltransferase/2-methoxy-6-polyprenyl-1,4-benzoquinol methylase